MSIDVVKPGMYSVFQDTGRIGFQRYGVHVNGALDARAHRLANVLAGNDAAQATLEITLMGPTLVFQAATAIVLTGADLGATLNSQPLPLLARQVVQPGDVLAFGRRVRGVRAYLAVHGGFDVPTVLGSYSTNVRSGFGGWQARALRKGDVITLRASGVLPAKGPRALPPPESVAPAHDAPLRIIAGREWARFSDEALHNLQTGDYTVTPKSDRMGFRLAGPALPLAAPYEMVSEVVALGTIQVPPDGQPIVLMADRGTSGGYPRIADVVSVDVSRLAQYMPGETVRFQPVTLEEAQHWALQEAQWLSACAAGGRG